MLQSRTVDQAPLDGTPPAAPPQDRVYMEFLKVAYAHRAGSTRKRFVEAFIRENNLDEGLYGP